MFLHEWFMVNINLSSFACLLHCYMQTIFGCFNYHQQEIILWFYDALFFQNAEISGEGSFSCYCTWWGQWRCCAYCYCEYLHYVYHTKLTFVQRFYGFLLKILPLYLIRRVPKRWIVVLLFSKAYLHNFSFLMVSQ